MGIFSACCWVNQPRCASNWDFFLFPHSSARERVVDIKEKKKIAAVTKKPALFCDFYRGQTANPHSWMLVSAQPGEGPIWARCLPVLAV